MLNEARKSPVEALVPGAVGVTKQMRSAGLSSAPLDTIRFIRELLYNLDVITEEDLNFVKSGKGFTGKKQAMLKVLQDNQDAINAKSDEIAQQIENTLDDFISGMGANRSREEKYAAQAAAQELAAQARAAKSGKEMDDALADVISDEKLIIKASLAKVIQQLEDLPGGEDISPDVLDEIKKFAPKINTIEQLESFVKQLSTLEEYQIPAAYLSSTVKAIKGGMEDIEMEDQEDPDFDAAKADLDKDGEISGYERTRGEAISSAMNSENEESGGKKYTATDSKGNKQYIHVNEYGTKNYFSDREMTILHREDGPAIEWRGGRKTWYLNGKKHREDGPAVEDPYGYKEWWINGQHHREDGPAVEDTNGDKEWWINGKLHREDGPALEWGDGNKEWYLNGEELTEEEFNARKRSGGSITEKRTTAVYLSEHINGDDSEESGGKKYTATDSKGNKQYIHVNENDTKFYFSDPEMTTLHREDGPALEWPDGYQEWYFNNKLHREDGPAVVDPNGYKAWYLHGERFDEEQFNARRKSGGNITEQHKAIAIPRSRIDENGNTTPVYPHIAKYAEDEIEEVYTSMYLTEQKSQDSLPKRKVKNNISFKERYKPKTYWQLEEARRYGL